MPLTPPIDTTEHRGDELPTVPGDYVVYELPYMRPLVLHWTSAERGWRINGSRVRAHRWFGPLPAVDRRTGALAWPQDSQGTP